MARYTGPACKLCRRVEEKLFLKGERCLSPKCAIEKRHGPPGDKRFSRRRPSDRAIQLKEKQKGRFMYGVLERQFSKYFEKSQKANGVTGELLLQWLERRLDNVVYRLSFAESRKQARQFVLHGHFTVNSRRVNIPSFSVKPGDIIKWHPNRASLDFVKTAVTDLPKREVPSWLNLNTTSLEGEILSLPEINDIDTKIDTRLIVEYYSK